MQYILADKYRFMRWLLLASRQLEDTYWRRRIVRFAPDQDIGLIFFREI